MDKVTMLKRLLRPGLLVTISIILIAFNYTLLGIILLIFHCIDYFYTLNSYWNKEDDIYYFSKKLDKGIEENVLQFIYPLALIKEDGEIIWCNKLFNAIQPGENAIGNNILSIARGFNLSETLKNEDNHQRLSVDNKLYDVYVTVIEKEDDEYIYLLSFNDITKLIDYEKTQEGVMLIEVDNLSEVLGKTEENNRPLLAAEVERSIKSYANNLKAMIEKYDTNKYVLSVQDKYIENEINKQFKIIDEVSKIDLGNSIEVTLSIGIGCGGVSPQENYNSAKFAKELALGRGGDQVVIKNGNDIKFFGGNTKEIEKRTKVKARVIARALRELICESSNVYILGHKNPDMDCLGAAMGLSSVVKQLGKTCNIILNNDNNAIQYYLDKLKDDPKYDDLFATVEYAKENINRKTLMIIVDVHNKGYISDLQLANKAGRKVIIDHHRRSPDMIENDILNYIEVYASSTSEMVTEIVQYMVEKPNITAIEAQGLLAGIFMDTKNFTFKTGVRTFEAASFLKSLGADPIEVKKMFSDDLSSYLKIADTIKSAEVNNKIAIAIAPENVDTVIIAKAADELLNISKISVSFVLGKRGNDVYISGRSLGDINVQIVLESLGGGGHMNIAGAKVSDSTIDEVVIQLKESIEKNLRIGE